MAGKLITERTGVSGDVSYLVRIREAGVAVSKTFKLKKEAEKFIREVKSKIDRGESVDITKIKKMTLAQIFDEYLKHNTVSEGKKYDIERLKLEIGKVPLSNFKAGTFELYLKTKLEQIIPDQAKKKKAHPLYKGHQVVDEKTGELKKKTYSQSTVRKYYYSIKTALMWHAKHHDYTFDRKPFDDNPPPKAWEPRDRILEAGELDRLLDATNKMYVKQEEWKCFIYWQYYSCMRAGESLLLKWNEIHLDEENPHYSYIFVPKENTKIADKKNAEDRKVPLRPEFYDFIKNRLMKLKKDDQQLVFGDYWKSSSVLGSRFRVICKNAKVENFKIHDLRHSAVSWYFINTSLTDIEISKISGHIELSTLKRYATLRHSDIGTKLWANAK
ncbi:site-specific integrase [Rivihabitans pingtungensis]|uniref:Phage integrase family protein n=1 Tax=Rivihabitans pingtungensis TaxID=1054498 RepID=A0A318L0Z3_9NEIS|nr:site-specific integrase [Rivihabitans pingtungensis]PXX79203.1 phage integrase family protein [Rivihabitans pingtungensis]